MLLVVIILTTLPVVTARHLKQLHVALRGTLLLHAWPEHGGKAVHSIIQLGECTCGTDFRVIRKLAGIQVSSLGRNRGGQSLCLLLYHSLCPCGCRLSHVTMLLVVIILTTLPVVTARHLKQLHVALRGMLLLLHAWPEHGGKAVHSIIQLGECTCGTDFRVIRILAGIQVGSLGRNRGAQSLCLLLCQRSCPCGCRLSHVFVVILAALLLTTLVITTARGARLNERQAVAVRFQREVLLIERSHLARDRESRECDAQEPKELSSRHRSRVSH